MVHVPGVVEKKVAESAWDYVQRWFTRNRDLKKRVGALEAQLAEERSGKLAFELLMSTLVCRPEDDNMYWKKDGSGGPYCPLCLHNNEKLIPLTHGTSRGSYYCRLHEHTFETQERRDRYLNYVPRPRSWPAFRQRLEAESYRESQRHWR